MSRRPGPFGQVDVRFILTALAFAGLLFLGMLVLLEVGRKVGTRRLPRHGAGADAGLGVVEGSVFGLLGLLLAFTFSGAATRFDGRRQLIVDEANAIGTAWLRIDLLPPDAQPPIRDDMRQYLDARLEAYRKLPDVVAADVEFARSLQFRDQMWAKAVAATRIEGGERARMLLLPALNETFDIAEARLRAMQMHPPLIIFGMLALLALIGALFAGYGMAASRTRNWVHMVGFAATIAIAVYVIVDLEYPRLGLTRVDYFDQALVELQKDME